MSHLITMCFWSVQIEKSRHQKCLSLFVPPRDSDWKPETIVQNQCLHSKNLLFVLLSIDYLYWPKSNSHQVSFLASAFFQPLYRRINLYLIKWCDNALVLLVLGENRSSASFIISNFFFPYVYSKQCIFNNCAHSYTSISWDNPPRCASVEWIN